MLNTEISELINDLCELKQIQRSHVFGYSESEISHYEKYFQINFPKLYREFLSIFGKDNVMLLDNNYSLLSVSYAVPSIYAQYRDLKCFVPKRSKNQLFYCFDYHDTYEYFLDDKDDPTVYYYQMCIGEASLEKSFSQRLKERLCNRINFYRNGVTFNERPNLFLNSYEVSTTHLDIDL